MSIKTLDRLLREMSIIMQKNEKRRLYDDIKRDFSLIGSAELECTHLNSILSDPSTKRRIKEYIRRWLEGVKNWSKKIDKEEKSGEKMEIYA